MQFHYVAYPLAEGVVEGILDARTKEETRAEVVRQGYKPLQIKPVRRIPSREELLPTFFRVGTGDLIRLCRSLAAMLKSGGNLIRTLETLHTESRSKVMRRTLEAIRRTLDEGGSLSEALEEHPLVFNTLFVRVIEVGEYTGRLGPALEQMADIPEKEHEAKKKAIMTLMYPAAIIGLALITMTVLMVVALPPLLSVFERMDTEVPLITRVVITVFGQIRESSLKIFVAFVAMLVVVPLLWRIPKVRRWVHEIQTQMPLFGPIVIAGELARFSRTMQMLLEAGVPLITALHLGAGGCKNETLKEAFVEAENSLVVGHRLADSLRQCPALPSMFVELVMIGEESNSLHRSMADSAEAYQKQLEQRLNALLALLEPASTVIVGGIVGLIAFSMFVPIYSGLDAFK